MTQPEGGESSGSNCYCIVAVKQAFSQHQREELISFERLLVPEATRLGSKQEDLG